MNLTFLNHRTSRPIAPESFGATEVGNAAAALTSWIASGLLKGADAGKSYSFSSALTIPNGTVIEGTLNLIWTGAADIPVLTIGDCEIENLSITVPSTSGNTASISTGYKGRSITVAGPGTSGTTFLTIADTAGLDLDLFECTGGFQRPLVLGNKAAWSTGGRIGFARIRDYTRAIGINYLDGFRLEGYDIHTRHAEATYEPGHNGILAYGLRNSYIAKGSIKDAGEHLFRLGGAAAMGASYNNDFGDMTLDNPGGSFIKLNADAIAYDLRFGDVVSVGRFMTAPGGNRELLRLSHVRDVSFGRVSLTLGEGAVWSAQDALALNDATDISIAHLHVDGIQQSVIDCVSGQDIEDGLGNGDVRNITIGGLTGNDPNTKPIVKLAMDAGFEASGLSIHGMDYFTDGALVTASGTTVVDAPCAISGRLRKTDLTALPSVSNLPVLMAVDLSVGDQKIINTITPQGQMSGSGNGVILGQQGSAATWNLRGAVFQSINMVRNRASGAGAASLWYGWSSGDSATGWIAINPDGTPRIRTGKGLLIEDATGVDLLNIKSTGVVVGLATTVASLPAAASNTYGRVYVSDSTVAASGNFGAIVAGGGANKVPLWSDGVNWLIG